MMKLAIFATFVSLALSSPVSNVFEIDISPEEAQRYLASPPFTEPQLSGRTAVLPLVRWNDPQFRSAEAGPTLGHYWKNGHEIENTQDYVEEVYDASQFHGQDGLGGYAYGYSDPNSAKVENRQSSGDLTGSYTFRDGNNELIKVRYWADSEGFHQEDNVPRDLPQPPQETEEVREARLAHEKAWEEAAAASRANPDPQGDYSAAKYETHATHNNYDVVGAGSEPEPVVAEREGRQYSAQSSASFGQNRNAVSQQSNSYKQQSGAYNQQQQQPSSYGQQSSGVAGYQQQPSSNSGYKQQSASAGTYSQQQGAGAGAYSQSEAKQQQKLEEPEPTGPPRGFFYSFTYPVSVIVAKNADGQQHPSHPGTPVDHDTVGVNAHRA